MESRGHENVIIGATYFLCMNLKCPSEWPGFQAGIWKIEIKTEWRKSGNHGIYEYIHGSPYVSVQLLHKRVYRKYKRTNKFSIESIIKFAGQNH